MRVILLHGNRRATLMLAGAYLAASVAIASLLWMSNPAWGSRAALAVAGLGMMLAARRLIQIWQPRLLLQGDNLVVYLRGRRPERVPLEYVECFFIGQSAHEQLRPISRTGARVENVTVVVRLAERATEWHSRTVGRELGSWKDGYITIFGLWTEPLNGDVVKRMNHQLAEYKRDAQQRSQVTANPTS